ncbi:MAG: hypothetical protein ABW032_04630 [Burkholderiaceae bacterium]
MLRGVDVFLWESGKTSFFPIEVDFAVLSAVMASLFSVVRKGALSDASVPLMP